MSVLDIHNINSVVEGWLLITIREEWRTVLTRANVYELDQSKTLTARAIAKTTGCTFINVRQSTLQQKYYGETQKVVKAIFSLAHKFSPSIIFVDECDSLFRARSGGDDHEATNTLRTEWMSLWDGLITSAQQSVAAGHNSSSSSNHSPPHSVTILACTNRPQDLDVAFMRRLPLAFLFPLPDASERAEVLGIKLLLIYNLSRGHHNLSLRFQTQLHRLDMD